MYYISKIAQAAGLIIISIDFIRNFPDLMSRKVLGAGIALFLCGWIVQKYLLKQ